MDNCRKSLGHVRWSSKLFKVVESALDLVAHGVRDIIARYLPLVIDEILTPYLGINLITSPDLVANLLFQTGHTMHLLLPMNIHTSNRLPKHGSALVFLKLGVSHSNIKILK